MSGYPGQGYGGGYEQQVLFFAMIHHVLIFLDKAMAISNKVVTSNRVGTDNKEDMTSEANTTMDTLRYVLPSLE